MDAGNNVHDDTMGGRGKWSRVSRLSEVAGNLPLVDYTKIVVLEKDTEARVSS